MLADACSTQLSDFFKRRRAEKKAARPRRERGASSKMTAGLMAPFAFISLPDRLPASPEYQLPPPMEPALFSAVDVTNCHASAI